MTRLSSYLGLIALLALAAPAMAAEEKAEPKQAILVDTSNGNVLDAVAPDAVFAPGNLAKLMTVAVIADAVGNSRISNDTPYRVSERAWRTGGAPSRNTTMFTKLGSTVAVGDLLRGIAVVQANDAAIVLAEGYAGSEDNFVRQMNAFADRIGLRDTRYSNATGLPGPNQTTTARDTVRLMRHLIERHPAAWALFAQKDVNWSDIFQRNKNPFLASPAGTDGGTAGALEATGHMAAISTVRDGRRLIAVVSGFPSADARDRHMRELIEVGFTGYVERQLFAEGEPVTQVRVFGGDSAHVTLVAPETITVAVPRSVPGKLLAKVEFTSPLRAPLAEGQAVATLRIWRDGQLQREVPLKAAHGVPSGGLIRRAMDSAREFAGDTVRAVADSAFRALLPGGA